MKSWSFHNTFESISYEEVGRILEDLEKKGLVFKTWDIKKQDYVWHKTELGHQIADDLGDLIE